MNATGGESVTLLCVDDEPGLAELVALQLERARDAFVTEHATSAEAALSEFDLRGIDCIVSDYDMPGMDGLDFLEAVRESHPELPFVLHTGHGSEEIASEAISAGVTDYVEKRGGDERYEVLANRVENAVERDQARREARQGAERLERTVDRVTDGFLSVDLDGTLTFCNSRARELLNDDSPAGDTLEAAFPDCAGGLVERLQRAFDEQREASFTVEDAFGDGRVLEVRAFPAEDGLSVYATDVTGRRRREQTLAALHTAASCLRDCETRADVGETLVEAGADVLDLEACVVLERRGDVFGVLAQSEDGPFDADRTVPVEESQAGESLRRGETIVVGDVRADPDSAGHPDVGSGVSVPLSDDLVFQACSTAVGAFEDDDREFAELLTSRAREALERIDSRERLERERDRFRAFFERLSVPVVRTRFEDGVPVITGVNDAFAETFGVDPERAVGESVDDLIVPEDRREEALAINDDVHGGEFIDTEVVRQTVDGPRPFRFRAVTLESDGDELGFGVYVDLPEDRGRRQGDSAEWSDEGGSLGSQAR